MALEVAQVGEHGGDVGSRVLVDAMQPHEGIEHEERGAQGVDGGAQAILIGGEIEPETGGSDDLDVEGGEVDPGREGDAVQALAHDVERVFGGVEEDAAGLGGRKAPQAGGPRGDGERDIEREEGLAALGLPADDADGLRGPEALDEPAALGRPALELMREAGGQERGHARLSAGARRRGLLAARGGVNSSR